MKNGSNSQNYFFSSFALKNYYSNEINCIYSDYNSDKLIFRIRMNNIIKESQSKSVKK